MEPIALQCYALLIKVFLNLSLEQLATHLASDEATWRLGWNKPEAPCDKTLSDWFGKKALPLEDMIGPTAIPGWRLDDTFVGDAFDIPTMLSQNSRDFKSGTRPPSYRPDAPFIRQHYARTKIGKLVCALDITTNRGPGSGDDAHLPALAERTKSIVQSVKLGIFDRGYGSNRNFKMLDNMHIQLLVTEKANEDRRKGKDWCAAAKRSAVMQHEHYPEYQEETRFRPETENLGSAVARSAGRIRLRRRKSDQNAPYPVEYDDDDRISHLPEEVIAAILDAAQQNVGVARLNESRAIIIVRNLIRLIVLEHLYDDRVDFKINRTFNPIPTVKEQDLDEAEAA